MPLPVVTPGRIDEPKASQQYADVLSRVAADRQPVIVRRDGQDLAAVVPLEYLELLQDILARQEAERLAARAGLGSTGANVFPPAVLVRRGGTAAVLTAARDAMTPPLHFGQIVWAELADANGVRKLRPAVVVTPDQGITPTGPLEVVAVTSRLPQPLPADHVLLPWHVQGHPRTGLNRKCAAVCSWLARIVPGDVQAVAGIVPGPVMLDILSRVGPAPPSSPSIPPPRSP